MTTRAIAKSIVQYTLEVVGLDDETTKIMTVELKINTLERVLDVTSKQMLRGDKVIVGDGNDVLKLQRYLRSYVDTNKSFPKTLDEWRYVFSKIGKR